MSVKVFYSKDAAYRIPTRKNPVAYSTCATLYSIGGFIVDNFGEHIVPLDRVLERARDYFRQTSEELQILEHLASFQKGKRFVVRGEYPYYFGTGIIDFKEI